LWLSYEKPHELDAPLLPKTEKEKEAKDRSWARGFADKCFLKGNVFMPLCVYVVVVLHSISTIFWHVGSQDEVRCIMALKKWWILCDFEH